MKKKAKIPTQAKWANKTMFSGIHYTLCTTWPMFVKELKHLNLPPNQYPDPPTNHYKACTHTFSNSKTGEIACVILFPKHKGHDMIEITGLLVHEGMHVWQKTRDFIKEANPSAEFEAYAMQNISQNLLEEFQRQTNRRH
jgi:hypothetical protein